MPVYVDEEEENIKIPCDELANTTRKPNIQIAINNINYNETDTEEHAHAFKKSNNLYSYEQIWNIGGQKNVDIKTGGDYFGAIHTHPPKLTFGLFSFYDIIVMYNLYKDATPENKNDVVFMVKGDEGIFAMKITDFSLFKTKLELILNGVTTRPNLPRNKKLLAAIDISNDELSSIYNSQTSQNNEKVFLKYVSDQGLSDCLSIYKKDSDNIPKWSKRTINLSDLNNLNVNDEPCNN